MLIVGLIAWKVIVDPRAKGTLSTISGALRKAIRKKNSKCEQSDEEWVKLDDEDKLAEVVLHIIEKK